MVSAIKAAIGDGVLTFVWVICASLIGLGTSIIRSAMEIEGRYEFYGVDVPTAVITTVFIFMIAFTFNIIADLLGGASFNPTATAASYAAGIGSDTLNSMALRFPAQAAGAVCGVLAIMEVMQTTKHKNLIGGPRLKVDIHTGAIAEGVMTFLITLISLIIILKGPRNSVLQAFLLSVTTIVFVVTGAAYTGPSMNPANAYGWAYIYNSHNTWEQFYVYWICPFVGAILSAWLFRTIFPPKVEKQKKPKAKKA